MGYTHAACFYRRVEGSSAVADVSLWVRCCGGNTAERCGRGGVSCVPPVPAQGGQVQS